MGIVYKDAAKQGSTTTGQGTFSLDGSAVQGYQAFSALFTTGDQVYYRAELPDKSEWEEGLGTLTSGSPWTLSRTTVICSSAGGTTKTTFSAGTKYVMNVVPASVVSLIATAVQNTLQVTAAGLVTGGGDLSTDRTLTVTAATQAEAEAGSSASVAMTPQRTAQAIAALGASSADIRALAMMLSEAKGDRINMPSGIFDPLADASDVGTTTNGDTSTAGKIVPTTSSSTSYGNTGGTGARSGVITISTTIGLTGGAIGDLIDGSQSNSAYFNNSVTTGTITFDFGSGNAKYIDEVKWYQDIAAANGTYVLEGSNDGSSWTTAATGSLATGSSATVTATFTWTTPTLYRYYRLRQISGSTSGSPYVREIEFKIATALPAKANMTLISNGFTAASAPTKGRITVQAKPIDAITLNTDLIAYVSRDGGTTFTAFTLALETALADGTNLYVHDGLDISAQPSGTSMKWKVVTANNKNIEVNGVGLRWS